MFSVFSADYFWVGGSGNWSDFANHWATTSGGTTYHTGVPTQNDDVYFDANSFTGAGQTVTIDQTIVFCRNMDWTGVTNNPTFNSGGSSSLNIYGSLTLNNTVTYSYNETVSFESPNTGNTITSNGTFIPALIQFNGVGGEWTFIDDFTTPSSFFINFGSVIMNGRTITVDRFNSDNTNVRNIDFSNSHIVCSGVTSLAFNIDIENLTYNTTNSLVELSNSGFCQIREAENFNFHDVLFSNPTGTGSISAFADGSTYNEITFNGNGDIQTSVVTNTLNLALGRELTIRETQDVLLTQLNAIGDCANPIKIRPGAFGETASITQTSGSFVGDYLLLQDIAFGGGATFTANNSADLGGTTGITINPVAGRDLYWVGGNGNWEDPNNWSLTSGGPAGVSCIPGTEDNVFFDANSFTAAGQTVTINFVSYCKSMDWTGATNNPTFAINNPLSIFGYLTYTPNMTVNVNTAVPIFFGSTDLNQPITSAGHSHGSFVHFQGPGGWDLQDEFTSNVNIYHYQGTLTTNSHPVNANTRFVSDNTGRSLYLGSSIVTVGRGFENEDVGLDNFDAGTSTIRYIGNNTNSFADSDNLTYYNIETTDPNSQFSTAFSSNNQFNKITLAGDGDFYRFETVDSLILSPGKTYNISTLGMNTNGIKAIGTCNGPITIKSLSNSGTAAAITQTSGNFNGDYLILQDLAFGGGATFTATNTIDLGGNTGISISGSTPRTVYWVGDSGDWQDSSNWAASSGGAPGECPPSQIDDVIFDANSFSTSGHTVTSLADISLNNIDATAATNNGEFSFTDRVFLYGDILLGTNMIGRFGWVSALNATGTDVQSGNVIISGLTVAGGGSVELLDDLDLGTSQLTFEDGDFTTNNFDMSLDDISSDSGSGSGNVSFGSSYITIRSGIFNAFAVDAVSFPIDTGTSTLEFTDDGSPEIRRAEDVAFHRVIFSNPSGTATISANNTSYNYLEFLGASRLEKPLTADTLIFKSGETHILQSNETFTVLDELVIEGSAGFPVEIESSIPSQPATFSKPSGDVCAKFAFLQDNIATGGANFYAENSNDISGNSGWTFVECALILAAELDFFALRKEEENVRLIWRSRTELDNYAYEIERSINGVDFSPISLVEAVGNSNTPTDYQYVDVKPGVGDFFYRLKLIDRSGEVQYSGIEKVNFSTNEFLQVTQDWSSKTLNIAWNASPASATIAIYSLEGKLVHFEDDVLLDTNLHTVPCSHLAKGNYFLRVLVDNQRFTEKIVFQ